MKENRTSHKKPGILHAGGAPPAVRGDSPGSGLRSLEARQQNRGPRGGSTRRPGRPGSKGGGQRPARGTDGAPGTAQSSPTPAQNAASQSEGGGPPSGNVVVLPSRLLVRDLAGSLGSSPISIIRELMKNGVMANINQEIDFDTAAIVAADLGFEAQEEQAPEPVEEEAPEPVRRRREYTDEELADLQVRPPVVTIMGHVDHGKTSLLDAIRQTDVAAGEVGGITQHIGAYQVEKQGKKITFLDTPGHEAFTSMRARGAMATDIAVLVIAADDGVQPQTIEAKNHARAAQVAIIVALNKVDKPNANLDAVKSQIADAGLLIEEYGGDIPLVPVSAKQQTGIDNLLEVILLVAEMSNLRANPKAPASGVVIEGRMDKTRGALATLLVQEGTLRLNDFMVVGTSSGKVRAMFDDKGQRIEEAPPSTPVVVLGLSEVPRAGEPFNIVTDEHTARQMASEEATRRAEAAEPSQRKTLSLEEFFSQAQDGRVKELNIILKADVQGSIEPIVNSVTKLGDDKLRTTFLATGTGNINESDVMLAVASGAIVLGFSVQVDAAATRLAEDEGVDIRVYNIIYRVIEDIDKALKGMLEPSYKDVTIGHAEVREIFKIPQKKQVAGCYVTEGVAARNAQIRVLRAGQKVFEGGVASLRRFKDDVREVSTNMECGIGADGFNDFALGDVIEFFRKEQVKI